MIKSLFQRGVRSYQIFQDHQNGKILLDIQTFNKKIRSKNADLEKIKKDHIKYFDKDHKIELEPHFIKELNFIVEDLTKQTKLLEVLGIELKFDDIEEHKIIRLVLRPYDYIDNSVDYLLAEYNFEKRIKIGFLLLDAENKGYLNKKDLVEGFESYKQENKLKITAESIKKIANAILEESNSESEKITFEEFKKYVKIANRDITLNKKYINIIFLIFSSRDASTLSCCKNFLVSITYNKIETLWTCTWIFIMNILFINVSVSTGSYLTIDLARGLGSVILYNLAVMLLLTSKVISSSIRKRKISKYIPLDLFSRAHKILGIIVVVCGIIHTILHIYYNYPLFSDPKNTNNFNTWLEKRNMSHRFREDQDLIYWLMSWPSITGYAILAILIVISVFSRKKQRNKNYESFWYTHMLWFPCVLLTIAHGQKEYICKPMALYWLAVPSFIVFVEQFKTVFAYFSDKLEIISLKFLASEVIELKVKRPPNFNFKAGQYANLNIDSVSKFQWHPFSFSSAPKEDYITFHISDVGDWTHQLKNLALENSQHEDFATNNLNVRMMGPYGTPSQNYHRYKHLLIIATGVGATPFSSIIRDLLTESVLTEEEHSIELHWATKSPKNHLWLVNLLKDVKNRDPKGKFFKMNVYFTDPSARQDMRGFLFWHGVEVLSKDSEQNFDEDHFGTIHWGRPTWNNVFSKKAESIESNDKVGVFFCGNNVLAEEILQCCMKFNDSRRFIFHKEKFSGI